MRLAEYREFGAIREVLDSEAPIIQPLHVVVREAKKPRIVIDLSRNLNAHLQQFPFHYSTVDDAVDLASTQCWFGKVDLSNCFLSFPMNESALKYLTFKFDGKLEQFVSLPFGLASAPYQCSLMLSVPAFRMRQAGLSFVRYLDDILFVAPSAAELRRDLQRAIDELESFGLVINTSKLEGPVQRITFLGIVIDSTKATLECSDDRIDEIRSQLLATEQKASVTVKQAQSLIGKLSFAAKVLPGARPFMRRLHDLVRARGSRHGKATLDLDAGWRADVRFWIDHLSRWNGRQRWRSSSSRPLVFATDASTVGFGFHVEFIPQHVATDGWPASIKLGSGFSGRYRAEHKDLHSSHTTIGWGELFAVLATLVTYGPVVRDQSLLFLIDNQSDVHILNRQATTSTTISSLLRRIYSEALAINVSLRATHRRGEDNVLADHLSRCQSEDVVEEWRAAYPHRAHELCVASVVYSDQFEPRSESAMLTSS